MPGETRTLTVGSALTPLDIHLSDGNNAAVSAKFVGFRLLDASSTQAVSGVAVNASAGLYQASGIVPAGFELGTWRVEWDIITQLDARLEATEMFCVQDVNVKIGFVPTTDKTGTIYEAVRIDLGDPDGIVFDDGFLSRTLTKAARRLNQRLGTAVAFRGPTGVNGQYGGRRIRVTPITLDLVAGTISPNNDEVCDLLILQIEYIIASSEISALKRLGASVGSGPFASFVQAAGRDGVSVTNADGVSVTVQGGRLSNRTQLAKFDAEMRKEELDAACKAFLSRNSGNFGKMVW